MKLLRWLNEDLERNSIPKSAATSKSKQLNFKGKTEKEERESPDKTKVKKERESPEKTDRRNKARSQQSWWLLVKRLKKQRSQQQKLPRERGEEEEREKAKNDLYFK